MEGSVPPASGEEPMLGAGGRSVPLAPQCWLRPLSLSHWATPFQSNAVQGQVPLLRTEETCGLSWATRTGSPDAGHLGAPVHTENRRRRAARRGPASVGPGVRDQGCTLFPRRLPLPSQRHPHPMAAPSGLPRPPGDRLSPTAEQVRPEGRGADLSPAARDDLWSSLGTQAPVLRRTSQWHVV